MKPMFSSLFSKVNKRIRWLFAFSVIAFSFFISLVVMQDRSQQRARTDLYAGYLGIKAIENTLTLVLETESAARGYLVTHDSSFLVSLSGLHRQLSDSLQHLSSFVTESPKDSISLLSSIIRKKMLYQDSFVRGAITDPAKLVTAGKVATDITVNVKRMLGKMLTSEENSVSGKMKVNERRNEIGVGLAMYGGIFALILVLAILMRLSRDISLRMQAEERLLESESKYRALIENAGVVMLTTDAEGTIGFANNQSIELSGYSPGEIVGKHFSVLVDPEWVEPVTGFYRQQMEERIPATNLEFLARNRKGEEVWVEQSAQLLMENDRVAGLQCMVKDITHKKLIEIELEQSEKKRKENEYRLLSILENTTALIFIKGIDGRYLMVNKRFKEVMGLRDEDVIGKTDFDFNPVRQAEYYQRSDEMILRTHSVIETEEIVESEEGIRHLLLLKFPLLDDQKNIVGISGIATDITDRVHSRHQLEEALEEAKEAKALQEQFLSNMSHEIRTPMNGIQGMTSLLLESDLNAEQQEFALMIRHSLNNLTAIINDILDYSNLRAGKIMLDRITFNINDPLEAVKIQFANQVNAKGLSFSITRAENLPSLITGDPYRLKQVLVSLVDNAIKFTEKGYIRIHVITEAVRGDVALIRFIVSDSGCGISVEKQKTIFEGFTRLNMDVSRSFGGAGLGLAISKGLITLQRGSITLESTPGEGSVFSFAIPYQLPVSMIEKQQENELKTELKHRHILVVEDKEVNQQLIRFVLKRAGCRVTMAGNGKEAIDLFHRGNRFDLVIMDLQMPVMDGYATAAYLRETLQTDIPILALTATALSDEQEKCRLVGMNDFMLKPFDFNDLYTRLVNLLLRKSIPASPVSQMNDNEQTLYDLSLLEELDDNESILDVLTMFLENTPAEVLQLRDLCNARDWVEIQRLAHKIKGAVAILQAAALSRYLAETEENARDSHDPAKLDLQIAEIVQLFGTLRTALDAETERLKKLIDASQA